jgi:hypothetical protein
MIITGDGSDGKTAPISLAILELPSELLIPWDAPKKRTTLVLSACIWKSIDYATRKTTPESWIQVLMLNVRRVWCTLAMLRAGGGIS